MKLLEYSSLIICGIVRNAEQGLRANIPIINALCKRCEDYRVVIYENDSTDKTKTILQERPIYQGVTIGSSRGSNGGVPRIGNNVVVFAGTKIIGNVVIGDNVVVGANAVVTKDVPANAVVVGVPAKVISYNGASMVQSYI